MSIKYKEIASFLRKQILSDGSPVSYKLPTEKELCNTYDASRQTIRQALDVLIKEGLIYSRQGSGIYTIPLTAHTEGKVVFLLSEEDEYTYPAFLSFMRNILSTDNITPDVRIAGYDYNIERKLLISLLEQPPIVLVVEGVRDAVANPNHDLYEQLIARNVSVIFINSCYSSLPQAYHISSDDYKGGYILGEHLISSGLYQVSCILPDFASNAGLRYQGLLAAYRDHSLPIPSDEIYWYSRNDIKQLREKQNTHFIYSFTRTLRKGNAVFCYNDEIAYHLVKELEYAKISIPEDIALVSFDNSYLSRISTPPLTTLSLGEHALENELATLIRSLLGQHTTDATAYPTAITGHSEVSYNRKISLHTKMLPWKLVSRSSVPTS